MYSGIGFNSQRGRPCASSAKQHHRVLRAGTSNQAGKYYTITKLLSRRRFNRQQHLNEIRRASQRSLWRSDTSLMHLGVLKSSRVGYSRQANQLISSSSPNHIMRAAQPAADWSVVPYRLPQKVICVIEIESAFPLYQTGSQSILAGAVRRLFRYRCIRQLISLFFSTKAAGKAPNLAGTQKMSTSSSQSRPLSHHFFD